VCTVGVSTDGHGRAAIAVWFWRDVAFESGARP
jgi:hypothetical protein